MSVQNLPDQAAPSDDEAAVSALYRRILSGWNERDGDGFAAPFAEDGEAIGFDGSQMIGQADIAATIKGVFADHPTGRFVGKIKGVRLLGAEAALLSAICGVVPHGHSDINPALNSLQTLVAVRRDGQWRVAHYQNTPAQFHGRPHLVEQLTEELRQLL